MMMMTTMEMTVFTSVPWRLLLPFRRAPRSHCSLIPAGSFRSFSTLLRVCSVGREHLPRRSACLSPRQSRGVAGAATPLLSSCPSVVRLPACHTAGRRGVLRSAEGAGGGERDERLLSRLRSSVTRRAPLALTQGPSCRCSTRSRPDAGGGGAASAAGSDTRSHWVSRVCRALAGP